MSFQRIDKSRRFIEVSKQLRQSIFNGDYLPGERLPSERELTDQFGVSRIIVREAIWDLKRTGLLEIKRGAHGGAFVQDIKHDAVTSVMQDVLTMSGARPADILEVRLIVEPSVAELAALNATAEDIQALQKQLQDPPTKKTPEMAKWSIEFHRMVAKSSHNPISNMIVNILMDFTEDLILGLLQAKPFDTHVHDDHSHPAILERIIEKDGKGAKDLYHDHLIAIKPRFDEWEDEFDVNFFSGEKKSF